MPAIKSWSDWIKTPAQWVAWPVTNIFNRRAEAVSLEAKAKESIECTQDIFPETTVEEAMASILSKRRAWSEHADRGEWPAEAAQLLQLVEIHNRDTLEKRSLEGGALPTPWAVLTNEGNIDWVAIAPKNQLSPEEATRRLEVMLEHRQRRAVETGAASAPGLRLAQ